MALAQINSVVGDIDTFRFTELRKHLEIGSGSAAHI